MVQNSTFKPSYYLGTLFNFICLLYLKTNPFLLPYFYLTIFVFLLSCFSYQEYLLFQLLDSFLCFRFYTSIPINSKSLWSYSRLFWPSHLQIITISHLHLKMHCFIKTLSLLFSSCFVDISYFSNLYNCFVLSLVPILMCLLCTHLYLPTWPETLKLLPENHEVSHYHFLTTNLSSLSANIYRFL